MHYARRFLTQTMTFKFICLTFVLSLLPFMGKCQQRVTINGYVEDAQSGEKIIGATIYEVQTRKGVGSNTFGFFSLTLNDSGPITIQTAMLGYAPAAIRWSGKQDTTVRIRLGGQVELKEVEIKAEQSDRIEDRSSMSTISLPVQQIKTIPALFGEVDVLKALQLLPGVQKGSEGNSGIYVRGGGPDQNLILLDGVPVYNASHLFGFFSVFNADALSHVDLIKGGFPARYGGRLSSVIDIQMKDGDNQKYHVNGGFGLIASRITVEGPIVKGKSSFIFSGRRTYLDILARPLIRQQTGGSNTFGYYFYDFNGKVNVWLGEKDRLFISSYLGDDVGSGGSTNSYSSDGTTNRQNIAFGLKWGNRTTALRWNHIVHKQLFMNATATYTRYQFTLNGSNEDAVDSAGKTIRKTAFNQEYLSGVQDFAGRINFDYIPVPNHYIRFGVHGIHHKFSPGASTTRITLNSTSQGNTEGAGNVFANEMNAYIEDDFKIGNRIKINLGVHQAFFWVQGKSYQSTQPRVSMLYRVAPGWSLKGSYATMTQFLHLLSNSGIGLPTDLWVPATALVNPQRAQQTAIGLAHTVADAFEVSVEGYYKNMQNLIEYKEGIDFLGSSTDWQQKVATGRGWSYGAEVLVQKKSGKTTGWIGYTLSWTNRQFNDKNFGQVYPYKYDRRHDIGITINHAFSKRFDASLTWVYGSGAAISVPLREYPDALESGGYNNSGFMMGPGGPGGPGGPPVKGPEFFGTVQQFDQLNNVRMRSYHRMDVGLNWHRFTQRGEWIINLSVYNVYSRLNPFFYYTDTNENGQQVMKQLSLFPIIPALSFNFKY